MLRDHDDSACETCLTYVRWVESGWNPFNPLKGFSSSDRFAWRERGDRDYAKTMTVHVYAARGLPSPMRRLNAMREYSYNPPKKRR
jgi:hypothetical protein